MIPSTLLLPLLAATSAFASASSDESMHVTPLHSSPQSTNTTPHSQKPIPKKPQCPALEHQDYQCPDCRWQDWCTPLDCSTEPAEALKFVGSTFDLFSLIFGFEIPPNLKLCPIGGCDRKKCLCREDVKKRVNAFLDFEGFGKTGEREKEEL